MARHSKSSDVRAALVSSVEFLFLLGLWMIFVSMAKVDELVVGIGAALISAFADGVVKAKDFAVFAPHLKSMLLIFWEPWYALKGTAAVFSVLSRRIAGKKSPALVKAIPFDVGGDNPESAARRALAVIFTTISPDTVVIAIDRNKELMLVHQIKPGGTPLITQRLGAKA